MTSRNFLKLKVKGIEEWYQKAPIILPPQDVGKHLKDIKSSKQMQAEVHNKKNTIQDLLIIHMNDRNAKLEEQVANLITMLKETRDMVERQEAVHRMIKRRLLQGIRGFIEANPDQMDQMQAHMLNAGLELDPDEDISDESSDEEEEAVPIRPPVRRRLEF